MELRTNDLFLDASFAIALVSARDEHHDDAVRAAEQYGAHPYVTTRPVLLEIGNALSGVGHREVAASYLEAVEEEPSTEIVPLSADLFRRGFIPYSESVRTNRGVSRTASPSWSCGTGTSAVRSRPTAISSRRASVRC